MTRLRVLLLRMLEPLRRRPRDNRLDHELQAHLDLLVEEHLARGMSIEDARRAARRAFGNIDQIRADYRDQRGLPFIDALAQDLRYGVRLLCRQPGFTIMATLTLALGIGATTLLLSVVYGVLLKPLPWPDSAQLVRVTETREGRTGRVPGTVSNGAFLAWRDDRSTIEDIGGWLTQTMTLTGAGDPVRVPINPTTPSLFRMLRVHPAIGRLFEEGEGTPGGSGLVILSYGLWQERFDGSPDIVGHALHLDDKPYTVVGVMPGDFAFPNRDTRAWTAWSVPPVVGANGGLVGVIFRAMARLSAGATPEQAAAEATSRARSAPDMGMAARALFGAAAPIEISVVPELHAVTADVRPALLLLLGAVVLLLMTATANVAGLQLSRATMRRRELAVRAAIGAGQGRLVRQLLIENAIVGLCGGAAGVALAVGLQHVLPWLLPAGFPRLDAITTDLPVLACAFGVSMLASVACGLVPAWHTRRINLAGALAADGGLSIGGATRSPAARTRAAIMAGQVAMACVLLVGAALLTRSFMALVVAERGFDPMNVLTAQLPLPSGYPAERRIHLLEGVVDRLRSVPGVTHAAYTSGLPLVSASTPSGRGGVAAFTMRSPRNPDVEVDVQATVHLVSPDYFAAMRLRLMEGRTLSDTDRPATTPAIVVNRTFARQYLGEHAVGVRLEQRGPRAGIMRFADDHPHVEVVGVVDDTRQEGLDAPSQPEIFALFTQILPALVARVDPVLVVRTTSDPAAYVSTLRSLVQEHEPALALDSVMTMEDRVWTNLAPSRLYAVVLLCFGASALLVVGVGLSGVLSFSVAQRTREIGVRAALGAQPRDIVQLVLRQALWIVGTGLLVGLAAAVIGVRLLSAFLHGISPHDTLAFVAVLVVIVTVAVVACLVPARRAARVDPLTAMRTIAW